MSQKLENDDIKSGPGCLALDDDMVASSIKNGDIALNLAAELDSGYQASPEVERRVRRKIDFILLPLISCTATLSFLDKVSNNYANNYGLSTALNMHGEQFSWSASVFYFSFLVWQPVVSYMNQHFPLGKVVSELIPMARFNSVAGILGGLFAYGIGQWHLQPDIHLYQYLYITYGAFTTAWGILLLVALPDSPVTAWFLNHEERLAAVARVRRNQTGMVNRKFKRDQVLETILDPKTWFYILFTFVSNVVNGGLNAFSTAIIKGFGFSTVNTTLLLVPWGFVATLTNIIIGLCISYTTGKRLFYMSGVILIPMIGTIIQFSLPHAARGILLFGYYLTGAYNAPYVMLLALVGSNTAGTTKKVVTSGVVWTAYCAGNIAGPFFFPQQDGPRYHLGTGVLLGSFVLQCLMALGFRLYLRWLNKQKESEDTGSQGDQEDSAAHAFADLTDKQNQLFRYTY
ncbi:hypothetical protein N7444_000216 [Penicillium canescens]|nr:hypothetical protein N7444_000216 [Penicillium canescens]